MKRFNLSKIIGKVSLLLPMLVLATIDSHAQWPWNPSNSVLAGDDRDVLILNNDYSASVVSGIWFRTWNGGANYNAFGIVNTHRFLSFNHQINDPGQPNGYRYMAVDKDTGFLGIGLDWNTNAALKPAGRLHIDGNLVVDNGDFIVNNNLNFRNNGDFNFMSAGITKLMVKEGGNVGIGTHAPQELLHLKAGNLRIDNGRIESDGPLVFRPDNDLSGDDVVQFKNSENSATHMIIDQNGDVGFGTDSPLSELHLLGNKNEATTLFVSNTSSGLNSVSSLALNAGQSGGNLYLFQNSEGAQINEGGANTATLRNDAGDLRLQANGGFQSELGIHVKSGTGKVGVGTASPDYMLEVAGDFASRKMLLLPQGTIQEGGELFIDGAGDNMGWHVDSFQDRFRVFNENQQEYLSIRENGNIGIGTSQPGAHKLAVNGNIKAREVEVNSQGWADHVFEKDYQLKPLSEVADFIRLNGHLPDVPSAAEVTRDGINLGKMDAILLQKIEELTLYVLKLQQENEANRELLKRNPE